jgi:hypothetical protein
MTGLDLVAGMGSDRVVALHRLIYASRVGRQVRFADADEIARSAVERNRQARLTGLLLYTPSHFVQVLEGEPADIARTYFRISNDTRHTHLRVIDNREVDEREFGAWAMTATICAASSAQLEALTTETALLLLRAGRATLAV